MLWSHAYGIRLPGVFVESISYVGMQQSERRREGSKRVLHPEDTRRTPGGKKYGGCDEVMIVSAFC